MFRLYRRSQHRRITHVAAGGNNDEPRGRINCNSSDYYNGLCLRGDGKRLWHFDNAWCGKGIFCLAVCDVLRDAEH